MKSHTQNKIDWAATTAVAFCRYNPLGIRSFQIGGFGMLVENSAGAGSVGMSQHPEPTATAMDKKDELHRRACIAHSRKACRDRYNLHITDQDINNMVEAVQSNKTYALPYGQTPDRSMHWIKVRNQFVLAVYDKALKTLATILPPNSRQLRPQVEK